MKKILALLLTASMIFLFAACRQTETPAASSEPAESSAASAEATAAPVLESESGLESEVPAAGSETQTPITLTVGDTVLEGYLNGSAPAQSLISQLPLTVTLQDSDNDFCGGSLNIDYSDSDVTSGYKNGDLVFWTPASNFVIFVSGEENSGNTGNLVPLGRVTSPQETLDALEGTIDVTIALQETDTAADPAETAVSEEPAVSTENGDENMQIKITVGETELYATLEDNATTRALMEQMPMTLLMSDLYGREMCYRYGAGTLPTDGLRSDGYAVGDIAYWPPRGSLVILYAQNGEQFERQHLGHIDSGVEVFETTGDADVTFEVVSG